MAKRVISGKVRAWQHTIFAVGKVAPSEKEIVIHFGRRVDYQVVKLATKGLPSKHGKQAITWYNNFAIETASGKYVKRVRYTVFLPVLPPKKTFVYYEDGHLKHDKMPKRTGSRRPRKGMVQVDFTSGDPGVGCKDTEPIIKD